MDLLRRERVTQKLRELAKQRNRIHVIPSKGKWTVFREDKKRASYILDTRAQAVKKAKELMEKYNKIVSVFVHKKDGTILDIFKKGG